MLYCSFKFLTAKKILKCHLLQIFVMWLDLVTYLHHHGHEEKLPWYRGKVLSIYHTMHLLFKFYGPKNITNIFFLYRNGVILEAD